MNENNNHNWPFKEAKNTAVFTTKFVLENNHPILYVFHDAEDGAWQFHSEDVAEQSDARIIALSEALDIDPSIAALDDLPEGWKATRQKPSTPWIREANDRRSF